MNSKDCDINTDIKKNVKICIPSLRLNKNVNILNKNVTVSKFTKNNLDMNNFSATLPKTPGKYALNYYVYFLCLRGWVYVFDIGYIDKIMKSFSML
jgi:hypothetical protein